MPSFRRRAKWRVEEGLTRVGATISDSTIDVLDTIISYLEVGRWMRTHGFSPSNRVTGKRPLFELILEDVADRQVLYLEFGVHRGVSMRWWSNALTNERALLHGFDSFEGLPERWNARKDRGYFSTEGQIPIIADPRVRFFKGWFEDTLPQYEWPEHEVLVANLDADLYSSTKTALEFLAPNLRPGSYLYFDQFMDRQHELRAFDEFLGHFNDAFRLVGANLNLSGVVFQVDRLGDQDARSADGR